MKRQLTIIAIAAIVVVLARPAKATLISINDPDFSFPVILDTQSRQEWVSLNRTMDHYTYNEIQAQLGPGGVFEGFNIATWGDLDLLFDNAGIYGANTTQDFSGAVELVRLFGPTTCLFWQLCVADGLYDPGYPVGPGDLIPNAYVIINYNPNWPPYQPDDITGVGVYEGGGELNPADGPFGPHIGIWLVRGSVVPEPSTFALLGIGIVGLIGYRWRRRK
jgi:hypothetical protein